MEHSVILTICKCITLFALAKAIKGFQCFVKIIDQDYDLNGEPDCSGMVILFGLLVILPVFEPMDILMVWQAGVLLYMGYMDFHTMKVYKVHILFFFSVSFMYFIIYGRSPECICAVMAYIIPGIIRIYSKADMYVFAGVVMLYCGKKYFIFEAVFIFVLCQLMAAVYGIKKALGHICGMKSIKGSKVPVINFIALLFYMERLSGMLLYLQ